MPKNDDGGAASAWDVYAAGTFGALIVGHMAKYGQYDREKNIADAADVADAMIAEKRRREKSDG